MTHRQAHVARGLIALLTIGALLVPAANLFAQQDTPRNESSAPTEFLPINDDDLLVLEVRLDNKSTGHGLIAYQSGEQVLLPLAELCSILELAITVDPLAGTAAGWIIDEDRTFALNLSSRTVDVDGELIPIPPGSLGRDENDIYVVAELVQSWLPIDVKTNLQRMNVEIKPREILPFQSRLKRDEQRSKWLSSRGRATLNYPMQVAPYRLWSWPLVDATLGFYSHRYNASRRFSLQSYFDLAGLSTNIFLSHAGTKDLSQTTARIKAGRWNPEGRLLGPARATMYAFGDLYISRVPMISTRKQGVGVTFSNQPLHRNREFDTTEIHGDATPGWEAELYINGSLYDFQTVGETGQYTFVDVPLIVGTNTFRTVLYGPRGETREVVEHANISSEMSEVGKLKYTATVLKEGESLLSKAPSTVDISLGAWNQQLELAYAFSNTHALVANVSHLENLGHKEMFSSITTHNSVGALYLQGILAKSMSGGHAYSLGLQTRLRGQNLLVTHKVNNDYRAEVMFAQRYLTMETALRSSGTVISNFRNNLFYSISGNLRRFADDPLQREQEVQFRLSAGLSGLLLSHNLRYRNREYSTLSTQDLHGTQLARAHFGPLSIRGDLNYDLSPSRLRSTSATLNWHHSSDIQATARAYHYFRQEYGTDNITGEFTRFFRNFSLGLNLGYYERDGVSVGVTLGTFLTKDIRSSQWAAQNRQMANRTVASARAFIDLNGNLTFDDGDEPLQGVGFLNLTAWRKIRTNSEGIALLPGLLVHRAQTIELNLATVEDPFLTPINPGVNIIGHPGGFVEVEFPFTYTGELEGMVIDAARPDLPVRHVGLRLLDPAGDPVQSTVAEFDGFYYFPNIYPGDYQLEVVPSTINTAIYEVPEPVSINVPGSGGFIEGPDILLIRKLPLLSDELPALAAVSDTAAVPDTPRREPEPTVAAATPANKTADRTIPAATESESADSVPAVAPPAVAPLDTLEIATADATADSMALATASSDTMQLAQTEPAEPEPASSEPDLVLPTIAAAEPAVADTIVVTAADDAATEPDLAPLPVVASARSAEGLADEPATFDEELALSLVFEMLFRNSLWPDPPQ